MKELLNQIIKDRDQSAEKFKEKVALEVIFEGKDPKEIVEAYQLASVHTVQMWVSQYNGKIKEGLITLPIMTEQERENLLALKKRVKDLEKSLEQANLLIYGLNSMIDYAERELEIPIRKKRGTKR